MDVDATLLASGSSIASRSFRGIQNSARLVSYLFLAIVNSLTSVFSCRDPPPIPHGYQVDDSDSKSTGTDPHDKSKDVPRLDPPNTGDGTLSGPGVNGGYADRHSDDPRSPAEAAKKVEVCCNSLPFRCNVVLTPSQEGKRHQEADREKKGKEGQGVKQEAKEAGERVEKPEVCCHPLSPNGIPF